MPCIRLETKISAPLAVCFDVSRNIELHLESTKQTGETAIAGKTSGLIELNETVTWRAKHLGVWQTLTSKITQMERPYYFIDEMVKGAFSWLRHEHYFAEDNGGTLMTDIFTFESPYGILGKLVNWLFLKRCMTVLLIKRNITIKQFAEQASNTN
jgi:ligand-binding SRPBCC domain-containing protein